MKELAFTSRAACSEAARRLSVVIESERRKIGHLTFTELCNADLIRQMGELERLINQYMLLVYINPDGRGRRKRR